MVGVGALSLPVAFNSAGLLLGTILLIVLAGMSYMTATFMIEAMAIANAYSKYLTRRNTTVEKPSIQQGVSVKRHISNASGPDVDWVTCLYKSNM